LTGNSAYWWTAILVVLMVMLILEPLGLGVLLKISGSGYRLDIATAKGNLILLYSFSFPLVGIIFYNHYINKRTLKALGFKGKNAVNNYLQGFLLGAGALSLVALVVTLFGGFKLAFNPQLDIILLVATLLGFGIQGLTEEVLCRAYLQNSIAVYKGNRWAIGISALVFTIFHAGNSGIKLLPIINLLIFGIIFSMIYCLTDNILLVGAIHSAWNFMQGSFMGIKVSGTRLATSVLTADSVSKLDLLTGEAFGLEGSVLTTILGLLLIYLLTRKLTLK